MYKVGDKVETPLGIGKLADISQNNETKYKVMYGTRSTWYAHDEITPYRTAHDKLIEMGLRLKVTKNYADGVFSHEWWNENDGRRVIMFYIEEKVTTVYEGNNEIMNVIPQYLEELEDE